MCKYGDVFSLAVLIDRGLDQQSREDAEDQEGKSRKPESISLYSVLRVLEALYYISSARMRSDEQKLVASGGPSMGGSKR